MKHIGSAVVSGMNLGLETLEPGITDREIQYGAPTEAMFEGISLTQQSCFTHQEPGQLKIEDESV